MAGWLRGTRPEGKGSKVDLTGTLHAKVEYRPD
jgi:hypothetical protein